MEVSTICVPGQRIRRTDGCDIVCDGTYSKNGYIYSSLVGQVQSINNDSGKPRFYVKSTKMLNVVPDVDDRVTAKVTSVNLRFCKCLILNVGKSKLQEPFRGILRKEDIRSSQKDMVEMYKSFKPGDIIMAKILSVGDAQSYILTTAENELGVVAAKSDAGGTLIPLNWYKMQCSKTLVEEFRKVAKVQSYFLDYIY